MIAESLDIDVATAALLSSAYTFPYALVQPALGVTGDFFGKTRLMNLCLLVVAMAALVCAVATSFSLLVAMRVAAGLVAGGGGFSPRGGGGGRGRAPQAPPGGGRG